MPLPIRNKYNTEILHCNFAFCIDFEKNSKIVKKDLQLFYTLYNSIQWSNSGGAVGAIAPASSKILSRNPLSFLKEHITKTVLFVEPYFNFCPTAEKCYYKMLNVTTS